MLSSREAIPLGRAGDVGSGFGPCSQLLGSVPATRHLPRGARAARSLPYWEGEGGKVHCVEGGLKSCLCSGERSVTTPASPAWPACAGCCSSLRSLFDGIPHRATGSLEGLNESSGDYFLLKNMVRSCILNSIQHVAHREQNSRVKCILLAMNGSCT